MNVLAKPAINEVPPEHKKLGDQWSALPKGVAFGHQLQEARDSKPGLYRQQMAVCDGPSWLFMNNLY